MSGDGLAIALFLWSLAALFFFEGRRDQGWRHWLLWGLAGLCFVAGPGWPYTETFWPIGFAFVRTIAVSPVSWFVIFMSAAMLVTISGRLKSLQEKLPDVSAEITSLSQVVRNKTEAIDARIDLLSATKVVDSATKWGHVDWTPWKLKGRYNISEFSRILAGLDPNGGQTSRSEAYKDLLIEKAVAGSIKVIRSGDGYGGKKPIAWNTELERDVAIAWAKANEIDVSHVE